MPIKSAKAFHLRMIEDEAFNMQYQNVSSEKERREFVMSAGYSFTPEEWEETIAKASDSSEGELSDKELTEVSGGIGSRSKPPEPSPTIPDPIDLDL